MFLLKLKHTCDSENDRTQNKYAVSLHIENINEPSAIKEQNSS